MISNNISWSTDMNFWSQSSMSVDFLRESASSSAEAGGSVLWCSHHSNTFLRIVSLTFCGVSRRVGESNRAAYIWDGNRLGCRSLRQVLQQVLDQNAALSDRALFTESATGSAKRAAQTLTNLELCAIGAMQNERLRHLDGDRRLG